MYGPAAALIATVNRLGWSVISASECLDDLGNAIEFNKHSPSYIVGLVRAWVTRWRWKRFEATYPAFKPVVPGTGPSWRPLRAALRLKDSEEWGPKQKGTLKVEQREEPMEEQKTEQREEQDKR